MIYENLAPPYVKKIKNLRNLPRGLVPKDEAETAVLLADLVLSSQGNDA